MPPQLKLPVEDSERRDLVDQLNGMVDQAQVSPEFALLGRLVLAIHDRQEALVERLERMVEMQERSCIVTDPAEL